MSPRLAGWAIMGRMPTFRLFGIQVTIRPSFLVIAALIGFTSRRPIIYLVAWVAIVFVSILIHELGHAITARSYGAEVEIELNGIGGLTSWSVPDKELGPGQRALVAAAGSGIGVIFGGLVWLVGQVTGPDAELTRFVVDNLVRVNVFWGLINWLPIRPLDGGHLFTSLLQKVIPTRAEVTANVVFFITAGGALAWALWSQRIFLALIAGWLLMGELTRGRGGQRRPPTPIPQMSFDPPPDGADAPADMEPELDADLEPQPKPGPEPQAEPEPER